MRPAALALGGLTLGAVNATTANITTRIHLMSSQIVVTIVSTSRCPGELASDLSAFCVCASFRNSLSRGRESRGGCGIPSLDGNGLAPAALGRMAAHHVRPEVHRVAAVQMFAHQHPALGQRAAPFRLFDL